MCRQSTYECGDGPDGTRQLLSLIDGLEGRAQTALERLIPINLALLDAHRRFHLAESFIVACDLDRGLELLEHSNAGFHPCVVWNAGNAGAPPFEHGVDGRFYSRVRKYRHEGGTVYWSMADAPEAATLINRCDEDQTYEARLAAGTLPNGNNKGRTALGRAVPATASNMPRTRLQP